MCVGITWDATSDIDVLVQARRSAHICNMVLMPHCARDTRLKKDHNRIQHSYLQNIIDWSLRILGVFNCSLS